MRCRRRPRKAWVDALRGRVSGLRGVDAPAPFDASVDVDDAFAGGVLAPGVAYEEGLEHFLVRDGGRACDHECRSDSCSGAVVEVAYVLAVNGCEPGARVVRVAPVAVDGRPSAGTHDLDPPQIVVDRRIAGGSVGLVEDEQVAAVADAAALDC